MVKVPPADPVIAAPTTRLSTFSVALALDITLNAFEAAVCMLEALMVVVPVA